MKQVSNKPKAALRSEPKVRSSALLAALARSIRKCRYATAATTVVENVRVQGERAQIQIIVTKDKDNWLEKRFAGIKCS
jgi:hypothetical protein